MIIDHSGKELIEYEDIGSENEQYSHSCDVNLAICLQLNTLEMIDRVIWVLNDIDKIYC